MFSKATRSSANGLVQFFVMAFSFDMLTASEGDSPHQVYMIAWPLLGEGGRPTIKGTIHIGTSYRYCHVTAVDLGDIGRVYMNETLPPRIVRDVEVNNTTEYIDFFQPVRIDTNDSLAVTVSSSTKVKNHPLGVINAYPVQKRDTNFIVTIPPLILCLMVMSNGKESVVTITPRGQQSWTHSISLDQSRSGYYWKDPTPSETGLVVTSSNAISLIAGHINGIVSIRPPYTWGTKFIGVKISSENTSVDVVYIYNQGLASAVAITTRPDQPITVILTPNDYFKKVEIKNSPGAYFIRSEKPIAVSVLAKSRQALTGLVPMRLWLSSYTFQTLEGNDGDCELYLLVEKGMELSILVNNARPRIPWKRVLHSEPPHSFGVFPARCRKIYTIRWADSSSEGYKSYRSFGCVHVGKGPEKVFSTEAGALTQDTSLPEKIPSTVSRPMSSPLTPPSTTPCNRLGVGDKGCQPLPGFDQAHVHIDGGEKMHASTERNLGVVFFYPLGDWKPWQIGLLILFCILFVVGIILAICCCYRLAFAQRMMEDDEINELRQNRLSTQQRRAVSWFHSVSVRPGNSLRTETPRRRWSEGADTWELATGPLESLEISDTNINIKYAAASTSV